MLRLLTINAAADQLGVPPGSLRTAAKKHGLLVRMGRTIRVDRDDYEELIQNAKKGRRSTTLPTTRKRDLSHPGQRGEAAINGRYGPPISRSAP